MRATNRASPKREKYRGVGGMGEAFKSAAPRQRQQGVLDEWHNARQNSCKVLRALALVAPPLPPTLPLYANEALKNMLQNLMHQKNAQKWCPMASKCGFGGDLAPTWRSQPSKNSKKTLKNHKKIVFSYIFRYLVLIFFPIAIASLSSVLFEFFFWLI